jgi:uncharacterized protein (TIGR03435 family)
MKKLMGMVALAVLQAGPLLAQTFAGTWQGTLQFGGRDLRQVFKIATTDADKLEATLYSIDQDAVPIKGTVTQQGAALKISVASMGWTYEGKLGADGNSITGTWSRGGPSRPLNLKRATPETAWTIPEPPPPPKMMAANADASFEVATIKPSDPARSGRAFRVQGREFTTTNTTLTSLITYAYGLNPRQVTGGPGWMESQKFDLMARPDFDGTPNAAQLATMVQKLLAERFQLAFHHDKKELSVYTLNVTKTGAKVTKTEHAHGLPSLFFQGLGVLNVMEATMEDFTHLMQSSVLDRPVVDHTGLEGKWDFILKWTPDETQFGGQMQGPPPQAASAADAPPNLFDAIQQQLGLKFEPVKAPVDVLVIDKAEKPSEN